MKSSIRISRAGRSISFRGRAARAAFEAITGAKLPPSSEQSEPQSISEEERRADEYEAMHGDAHDPRWSASAE